MYVCLVFDVVVFIKDLYGFVFVMLYLIECDFGKYCILFEFNDNEILCFRLV